MFFFGRIGAPFFERVLVISGRLHTSREVRPEPLSTLEEVATQDLDEWLRFRPGKWRRDLGEISMVRLYEFIYVSGQAVCWFSGEFWCPSLAWTGASVKRACRGWARCPFALLGVKHG